MFFCPNCDNVFDITNLNDKGEKQDGGAGVDWQEVISKILAKEDIDQKTVDQISVESLVKQDIYNGLKSSVKEYVHNKVLELTKDVEKKLKGTEAKETQNRMYFICRNCGTTKQIKDGTLLFSKVSGDISQSYVASDLR